ncbi:MAG: aspartate/glutamate racemase family protein [Desulfovibrio sp.]|nr:aspartate/glutamate racemase family protein [Desulfovibrio sp.]
MDRHCIGIVGGLGPYAGLDLVQKVFDHTRAIHDQDHVRLMLHSFPSDIPVRQEFLLGLTDVNPGHAIGEVMAGLVRAGADIVGMPCNTAHSPRILDVALERLQAEGAPVRFVHIIDAAVDEVRHLAKPGARIGLMGTVATLQTRLYQDALEAANFVPVVLDSEGCQQVQEAISNDGFGIKASSSPVTPKARGILLEAARRLAETGIDVLLLGCTEIPLALDESEYFGIPAVDATTALARDLVRAYDPARLR